MKKRFLKKLKVVAFAGKVIDLKKEVYTTIHVIHGIKKNEMNKYPPPRFQGSHGTVRVGFPEVDKGLFIYAQIPGYKGIRKIDIWRDALELNGMQNISEKLIKQLRSEFIGKTMKFCKDSSGFTLFDKQQLIVR